VTLLDAISQAQGLTENAGSEISGQRQTTDANDKSVMADSTEPARLMSGVEPALNLHLEGGEEIRVPEAGRVFVLGRVKKPGAFYIRMVREQRHEGAGSVRRFRYFSLPHAYITVLKGGSGGRNEIPIDLKKIMDRKSPDVPLSANDILYVPDATGARQV